MALVKTLLKTNLRKPTQASESPKKSTSQDFNQEHFCEATVLNTNITLLPYSSFGSVSRPPSLKGLSKVMHWGWAVSWFSCFIYFIVLYSQTVHFNPLENVLKTVIKRPKWNLKQEKWVSLSRLLSKATSHPSECTYSFFLFGIFNI